jgi:antitoxin ParD1/3/4
MPDTRKISIDLEPEQIAAIEQGVASGDYATADEVVREALRDWQMKRGLTADDIRHLRRRWDEGKASGAPADFDLERILGAARKRFGNSAAE